MQSTKAEDAKPGTNPPQAEGATGEATLVGQRKGKQKKNRKKNKASGRTVADPAAKTEDPRTTQMGLKNVLGEGAKLAGPKSIEPVGSETKQTAELKTKEEVSEKREGKKGHTRVRSVTIENVSETLLAKVEIPVHKSTTKRERATPLTETCTLGAAPQVKAHETPSPSDTREAHIQPTASPSATPSESVPITPTSPPAAELHLDFSPAAIFPHSFQAEEPPKHVFNEPNMMHPVPSPIHPHRPERITAEDLVHTVRAHHHTPHYQALQPQPNRLQTKQITPQDAFIPCPPKPKSPAPPLHVPGPGVTAGRIVMLADPPPPIGCLAPTRERQLTEYNIGHVHAGHIHPGHGFAGDNPYPARSPQISSTEAHPMGYAQNTHAPEWPGTAMRKDPYDSGLGGRSDEDEDNGREEGGLFGRRMPTGATVNTKGYHRRGEDVGLVASLVNLWEKSRDWFQEWVQATRW